METPINEVENVDMQKKVEFQDLNEEDSKKVTTMGFQEFKVLFPFNELQLNHAIHIMLVTRQHLENKMSQVYFQVKDAHKKHAWLNHKIHDLFKTNTILLIQQERNKVLEELKAASLNGEKHVAENIADVHVNKTMNETPMEQQGIEDKTGERRFHVVPNKEVQ